MNACFYCGKPAESGLCQNWKHERHTKIAQHKHGLKVAAADYTHKGESREF